MKIDSDELEQLAEWYRLPSDIYQTAQSNDMHWYKNCSLSEIKLNDDDILEDTNPNSDLDKGNIIETDNVQSCVKEIKKQS